MHKRAFEDLKLTFLLVSGLPLHILIEKNQVLHKMVFYKNMAGKT